MWWQVASTSAEVILAALLTYGWVILVLRLYGKRTLAKLNAFDFIVTVALGSMLSTVILNRNVTFIHGAVAFVSLATLQWLVAAISARWEKAVGIVRASPRLLLLRGEPLLSNMQAERIVQADLRAAARAAGLGGLADIFAIVLETDGSMGVIKDERDGSAMMDVFGFEGGDP